MQADVFEAGSDEGEVERRNKVLVMPHDQRGMLAQVLLTNDRVLFSRQLFASSGEGGLVALLAERQIQKRYDKKSGGPTELVALADIRSAKRLRRPLRGDLYEFTLEDGSTCGLGASAGKTWDPQIRRLLAERHGRTVVEDGETGWQVELGPPSA
jgi:hypothetical protein